MTWKLLVVRKDSPIRMYNVTRQRCVTDLPLPGSTAFDGVRFDKFLIDNDGAFHVDLDQLQGLMKALVRSAEENPNYFRELADRYENMGREWLDWTQANCDVDASYSDDALFERFDTFCKKYVDYTPVLFVPFAVELRYRRDYPGALERLHAATGIPVSDLTPLVETTRRRTMAEEKGAALAQLRGMLDQAGLLDADASALRQRAPEFFANLEDVARKFAWIAHWGYPPFYADSSFDDLLNEARLHRAAQADLDGIAARREALLDHATISTADRTLFDDVARWAHLRTWRMEVKIRCQRLSVPLLREIERRIVERGTLRAKDDIFFLTPPEIAALADGSAPRDVAARRDGWVLIRDGGATEMRSGLAFRATREQFLGVIDDRADARGIHPIDRNLVGGKALRLFELRARGVNVPRFFVISTVAYDQFQGDLERARIRLGQAVSESLGDLHTSSFMVRSSATVEDAAGASWAGRFRSVPYVTPSAVWDAIRQVWASLAGEAARDYAQRRNLSLDSASMAVVVQAMIDPDISGVADVHQVDGRLEGIIEIVAGQGEALVTEGQSASAYFVSGGAVKEFRPQVQARVFRQRSWLDYSVAPTLEERVLPRLLESLRAVVEFYGGSQNIEFCVCGEDVYILQARPNALSATSPQASRATFDNRIVLARGLPGTHHTEIIGRARKIAHPSERGEIDEGSILVIHAATPAWDSTIMRAGALVTNEGGSTSHAVRVCNELGIGVVAGTGNATSVVAPDQQIIVDTRDPFVGYVRQTGGVS